ncbi:MAG: hypothetical protein FAF05_01520 [Epsilonproteobacteria bacterium]|nr:hypothetical protein [Campylobacterota bacterium]
MARSVLLQLARDSINEVLQMQNLLNKQKLLIAHPALAQKLPTTIELFLENEFLVQHS